MFFHLDFKSAVVFFIIDESCDLRGLFSKTILSFLSRVRKILRALPGYERTAHMPTNIIPHTGMHGNTKFSSLQILKRIYIYIYGCPLLYTYHYACLNNCSLNAVALMCISSIKMHTYLSLSGQLCSLATDNQLLIAHNLN